MALPPRLRAYLRDDPGRLERCRAKRWAELRKQRSLGKRMKVTLRERMCYKAEASDALQKVEEEKDDLHLMKLPPELRNLIWEYAVAESSVIIVDAQLKQPSWMATSEQVRQEALPLWYLANVFSSTVFDLDARLEVAWFDHILSIGLRRKMANWTVGCLSGSPHWKNLLEWAKSFWNGRSAMVPFTDDDPTDLQVVARTVLSIAFRDRAVPWEELEQVLSDVHYMVAFFDDRRALEQ